MTQMYDRVALQETKYRVMVKLYFGEFTAIYKVTFGLDLL